MYMIRRNGNNDSINGRIDTYYAGLGLWTDNKFNSALTFETVHEAVVMRDQVREANPHIAAEQIVICGGA